jgi:acyl-CoA synthetase (AMP-forming)/AMP-acid ligase II
MLQWTRSRCRLLITYGVTEVTVYQTIHNATAAAAAAAADEQTSSRGYMIGKALQGVGVAVVDSNNALIERGQPGQIVLFGPQVMRTCLCACLCLCAYAHDFLSVLQSASCLFFS